MKDARVETALEMDLLMERVPESIRFSKVSNITMSFYRIQIKVRHGISGTSDICVKYFRVRVRFSRFNAKITLSMKFAKFRLDFLQNKWSELVFE